MTFLTEMKGDLTLKQRGVSIGRMVFWGGVGLVLALLMELALVRLFLPEQRQVVMWLSVATPYLYLPAYGILLLGVWRRQWVVTAVSAVLVALHLFWVLGALVPVGAAPAAAPEAAPLRLFSANLLAGNRQTEAMIAEILAEDPDVLAFQEYTSRWHGAFLASEMAARYPYRVTEVIDSPFGSAIWSKEPFLRQEVWFVARLPVTEVTLAWEGEPVRIFNLHPPPPFRNFERWNRIVEEMVGVVTAVEGPVIVAGDFNFSQYNDWYHTLQAAGLRNAYQSLGRGWATTFPNGTRTMPPMRIDHVFLSEEIAGVQVREGIGKGSDHKPIIVDVAPAN